MDPKVGRLDEYVWPNPRHQFLLTDQLTWASHDAHRQWMEPALCARFGGLHENILHRRHGRAMPLWQERIFAAMMRNASHVTDYFRLPTEQVVEIGRQISI